MKQPIVLLLLLVCQGLRAEYKWTGTEWEWVESERDSSLNPAVDEGSGDGDDYDYNSEYDYSDKKAKTPVSKVNANPVSGFTDDEDFVEGSGDPGFGVESPLDRDDEPEGSGGFYFPTDTSKPASKTTTKTTSKTTSKTTTKPTIKTTTKTTTRASFSTARTTTTTTTESFPIDLDKPSSKVPEPAWNTPSQANVPEDDYPENYEDGEGDDIGPDAYDYATPYDDDISIDEVPGSPPSTSTTTTTTTTTTPSTTPFSSVHKEHDETPIISDIPENRPVSFFAQPGILAAVIGGAVVGLLCAILLVMFIVYRMRKKDEGSYILDEPKRTLNGNLYTKTPNREFYA